VLHTTKLVCGTIEVAVCGGVVERRAANLAPHGRGARQSPPTSPWVGAGSAGAGRLWTGAGRKPGGEISGTE
jgi:hypothetical protein